MSLLLLPNSLLQYITDFLNTHSALQLLISNKYTNTYCVIKILDHKPKKLTKEILEQKKYDKLEHLNISGSKCKITNSDIKRFTKIKLFCISDNKNITDINHLLNLQTLFACGESKISNASINELKKIKVLHVGMNPNITNINHLFNLEKLYAWGYLSKISNSSISHLKKIKLLDVDYNLGITDVNHLTELEELYAVGDSGISDTGISNLKKIKKLVTDNNLKVTMKVEEIEK